MKKPKWTRDTGKPYIRRANGKEDSDSFRVAFRLAFYQTTYGRRGFYVLVQRGFPNTVVDCGKSRKDLVEAVFSCNYETFDSWANGVKCHSQGRKSKRIRKIRTKGRGYRTLPYYRDSQKNERKAA